MSCSMKLCTDMKTLAAPKAGASQSIRERLSNTCIVS